MTNREEARLYFLENDERCRVWESKGITWVLHHKDPSWQYDDPVRYSQWNIEDLLPMTKSAHTVVHWTGKHHSLESIKKMSEHSNNKGENNPMYGKRHSEESKLKMSENNRGENNPNYGKSMSSETRKRLSEINTGKQLSEEHKRKISESHKGFHHSEESRKKMSEYRKGLHYYNNGTIEVRRKECPEGFVPGRLKKQ